LRAVFRNVPEAKQPQREEGKINPSAAIIFEST
jgi:hypothetical protein